MRRALLLLLATTTRLPAAPPDPLLTLGRNLFADTRLSADGKISCASCHDPQRAFTDGQILSPGVFGRRGDRHTPSLFARAGTTLQFWDGRAPSLEAQVLEPIRNPNEMDMSVDAVLLRLRRDPAYANFTATQLAAALAAYIRSIRSINSPIDNFLHHNAPLTPLQREGFRLFRDKARCYICHSGDHFTDESFHNTGIAWTNGQLHDAGRARHTGRPYHRGAFKTPSLREIARTAPYMHDGSLPTLEAVIDFYDEGGRRNPWLDENIVPLHLSPAEKQALAAFLRALSGTVLHGE